MKEEEAEAGKLFTFIIYTYTSIAQKILYAERL
jgi:hypothetical protein